MSDVREGDADARYKLFFFFNGGCLFVSMADVREGDADALYELASRYFRGDGVEKSEMKAFELLEDTIKSDGAHAAAINDLAVLFCQGICIHVYMYVYMNVYVSSSYWSIFFFSPM